MYLKDSFIAFKELIDISVKLIVAKNVIFEQDFWSQKFRRGLVIYIMKKLLFVALLLLVEAPLFAQIVEPVKWSFGAKRLSKTEAVLFIKATLDKGWHIYSQNIPEGGPIATSFAFSPSKGYVLSGKTVEPKPISKYEKVFNMNVSYFENSVIFQQRVKLNSAQVLIKGKLEYMACNDTKCLPPDEKEFSIVIK